MRRSPIISQDSLSSEAKKLIELCGEYEGDSGDKLKLSEALKKYPELAVAMDEYVLHRERCGIAIDKKDITPQASHSFADKLKKIINK